MFSLSFVSRIFLFTFWFLQKPVGYLEMCYLISVCLCFLQFFSCNFTSSFITLWSEKMLDMISIFLNLLRFDLWPKMWSILENVSCELKKNMYSSALDGMSWWYQWDPSHLMYHLKLVFPDFLFWWSIHSCEWGVKIS